MEIEALIAAESWTEARREIQRQLRSSPDDHWLLTRLALTYYEQHRYKTALRYEKRARELAPWCPLVLWGYAGTLQMLGDHRKAIPEYLAIVRKGVDPLANGLCGEGRAWARGLVADCHLRLSDSYEALGDDAAARLSFERHLDERGPGCRSIYSFSDIPARLARHQGRPHRRPRP